MVVRASQGDEVPAMRGEFVDVGGTRLYYYAAGSRGGGDPVVLLHGFPGSSHSWRMVAPLLPEGRRLVVPDLVGSGRSDGPGRGGGTLDDHAALIAGLLDDLGIARTVLVGHGFGGAVALAIAVKDPARVSALALIGTPAFAEWPRRLARLARLTAPLGGALGPAVLASFVHGSALRGFADPEVGRRSLDVSLRASASRLGLGALRANLRVQHDPAIRALAPRLAGLAVPTAVIWGEADPFLDQSVGRRLQGAIPGATLTIIPGARHFVAEDAPDQCARAIRAVLDR